MVALVAVPVVTVYATLATLFVLVGPSVFGWPGLETEFKVLGMAYVLLWFAALTRRVDYRSRDTFFNLIPLYNWVFQIKIAWRYAAVPARPWPTGFEPWARHDESQPSGPARDVVATWAFIGAVAGALVLPALGAVVLGIVGLRRVTRKGVGGRAFALTGLIAGLLWILLITAVVVRWVATPNLAFTQSLVDTSTAQDVTRVSVDGPARAGDCIAQFDAGGVVDVTPVPCEGPHKAQIIAMFELPSGPVPSSTQFDDIATRACAGVVTDTLSDKTIHDPSLSLGYVYPRANAWRSGDRIVQCVIYSSTTIYHSSTS